jgi:hypothetical protein
MTIMKWQHGLYGYQKKGCRCPACMAAHRVDAQARVERRADRLRADPSLAPHGQANTYTNWGCRCLACARAHNEHVKQSLRSRATPAFGREWVES